MLDNSEMQPQQLAPSALTEDMAAFRRFNRMYTRFIGTLQEGLLNSSYSLAEARVLYELANREAPKAKEIAEELGMDPGYLSRLLGKFERDALLKRKASEQDNRYADLILTRRGKAAFRELNALSDEQARKVLGRLLPGERTRFIQSMLAIEGILMTNTDRNRAPFVLRPHRVGDMGWVVSREGAVYAEEYGWDDTFEALVARVVADFLTNFDPKRERCWIAEVEGQSIGHIFLVKHPEQPDVAKLRLLFVEPSARGMRLGHTLVNECIQFARTAGYRRIVLWTQSILVAAHSIYRRAGFQLVREEPHHSFGKDLIGQTWELELT
ncbi:MAG TPA: helix-turn-helix domain-containing GNAT family N-acetyltransferase [Bryobacteraceae bacterium]|jgi:DNA-binding MarR family transcriptional regulator/GNAT superfamily N-acetyltransferase